jgi:hypothetical protein
MGRILSVASVKTYQVICGEFVLYFNIMGEWEIIKGEFGSAGELGSFVYGSGM